MVFNQKWVRKVVGYVAFTWAMQPLPSGLPSSSVIEPGPNAASTEATEWLWGWGRASECSWDSLLHIVSGKTSMRVAAHWENLTNAGPLSWITDSAHLHQSSPYPAQCMGRNAKMTGMKDIACLASLLATDRKRLTVHILVMREKNRRLSSFAQHRMNARSSIFAKSPLCQRCIR